MSSITETLTVFWVMLWITSHSCHPESSFLLPFHHETYHEAVHAHYVYDIPEPASVSYH